MVQYKITTFGQRTLHLRANDEPTYACYLGFSYEIAETNILSMSPMLKLVLIRTLLMIDIFMNYILNRTQFQA